MAGLYWFLGVVVGWIVVAGFISRPVTNVTCKAAGVSAYARAQVAYSKRYRR